MSLPATILAARMHRVGGEQVIEKIPMPKPGSMDVLIKVKACGIVPNLGNILALLTNQLRTCHYNCVIRCPIERYRSSC